MTTLELEKRPSGTISEMRFFIEAKRASIDFYTLEKGCLAGICTVSTKGGWPQLSTDK
jgi:hypothetical protein